MLVPNVVWTLVELFLIIYILYIIQRFVMNAQTMAYQVKVRKMFKTYTKIFSASVLTGLAKALGDLTKDESKKEKPKKNEEDDSDDDIDLDDLLN